MYKMYQVYFWHVLNVGRFELFYFEEKKVKIHDHSRIDFWCER